MPVNNSLEEAVKKNLAQLQKQKGVYQGEKDNYEREFLLLSKNLDDRKVVIGQLVEKLKELKIDPDKLNPLSS